MILNRIIIKHEWLESFNEIGNIPRKSGTSLEFVIPEILEKGTIKYKSYPEMSINPSILIILQG